MHPFTWRKPAAYNPKDLMYHNHPEARLKQKTLAPSLLGLYPLCPPIYDQANEGSCHDDQTEVLTKYGWKFFADLEVDDELATVNPKTKELTYELPTRLVRFHYSGPMHYVKHRNIDFAVTPDHKMLVRKWDQSEKILSDKFTEIEMRETGWYYGLMHNVIFNGTNSQTYILNGVDHKHTPQRSDLEITMQAWMRLLGIYLAEGTLLKNDGFKIQLAASKEREKQFIRDVLSSIDQHYLELSDRFTFENKRLYSALVELGLKGVKAPDKFIPEFVFELHPKYMNELLLGHFMGDGYEHHGQMAHSTSSRRLADDIQRLIFLNGGFSVIRSREPRMSTMKDGRVIKGKHPEYRIYRNNKEGLSVDRKENEIIEEYEGEVFCAEVPTHHTLVTRRNGRILISGNCTANAGARGFEFLQLEDIRDNRLLNEAPEMFVQDTYTPVSRNMLYYQERVIEGDPEGDNGAEVQDTINALKTYGVCLESLWPYDDSDMLSAPTAECYAQALNHKLLYAYRINDGDLHHMKVCLTHGYPFILGFTVYSSFMSDAVATTGIMPVPDVNTETVEGGHAVCAIGYDDSKSAFLVANSWGTSWGDPSYPGYFWFPYQTMGNTDITNEFWTMRHSA